MPNLGDLVELTVDIPEYNLREGMRGTIAHCHDNAAYEVEFTNTEGETIDFLALCPAQFIVVWRAEMEQWVPIAEQIDALINRLPIQAAQNVLDYARFLAVRSQYASA